MNQIVLFEDGSWQWRELATIKIQTSGMRTVVLTIGDGWYDNEVSRMVSDYYHSETLSWIFDQE